MAGALDTRVGQMLQQMRVGEALRNVGAAPAQTLYERAGQARFAAPPAAPPPVAGAAATVGEGGGVLARGGALAARLSPYALLARAGETMLEAPFPNSPWRKAAYENMAPLRQSLAAGKYGVSMTPGEGAITDYARGFGRQALDFVGLKGVVDTLHQGAGDVGRNILNAPSATPNGARAADKVAASTDAPPAPAEAGSAMPKYTLDDFIAAERSLTPRQMQLLAATTPKPVSGKDRLQNRLSVAIENQYAAGLIPPKGQDQPSQEQALAANKQLIAMITAALGQQPMVDYLNEYDPENR